MTKLDESTIHQGYSIYTEQQLQQVESESSSHLDDESCIQELGSRTGGIGEKKVIIFSIITLASYYTAAGIIGVTYSTYTLLLYLLFCPIPPIFWLIILYWIENKQDAYLSTLIEALYIGIGATLWLFAINATLVLCTVLLILISLFWLDVEWISWILLITIYCFITPLTIIFTITFCCFIRLSHDLIINKYSALLTGVAISLGISFIFSISDLLYRQYSYSSYYSELQANDNYYYYYINYPPDDIISTISTLIMSSEREEGNTVNDFYLPLSYSSSSNGSGGGDNDGHQMSVATKITGYLINETSKLLNYNSNYYNNNNHHINNQNNNPNLKGDGSGGGGGNDDDANSNIMQYLTIGFIEYAILDPLIKIGCGAWIATHLASFRFKLNPLERNPSYWKIMGVPFLFLVVYNLSYRLFGGGSSLLFETFAQLNYQKEFISHLIIGLIFGGIVVMYIFVEKMRLLSELKEYLANLSNHHFRQNEEEYNVTPISLTSDGSLNLNMVSLDAINSDDTDNENHLLVENHDHNHHLNHNHNHNNNNNHIHNHNHNHYYNHHGDLN